MNTVGVHGIEIQVAAARLAKYLGVKSFAVETLCKKLQEIIKEICLKLSQLYNADVTGLF
jgi:plasmid maintenance system antidote protein VapI